MSGGNEADASSGQCARRACSAGQMQVGFGMLGAELLQRLDENDSQSIVDELGCIRDGIDIGSICKRF